MKTFGKMLGTLAMIAAVCSCGNKNEYQIVGALPDESLNGEMVYLYDAANPSTAVDSVSVAGSTFTFTGTVEEPWIGVAVTPAFALQCVVEPGAIKMTLDEVGGTAMNESFQSYRRSGRLDSLRNELQVLLQAYYGATDATMRAEVEHQYDSVEAIANGLLLDRAWELYRNNDQNVLGAWAMSEISQYGDFSFSQFDSILKEAAPVVKNYQPVSSKLEQLRCVEATSAGKHYTDIQGVDGKLSDLIEGKLALVDFWASWCGPCRAEIKDNLVPLWNKYQKKGLVIVGLNVWERGNRQAREDAHKKAMNDLGITYPQLVDSTRVATDTYGVRGIPQIMLIGPDGTILARDLRGADIEEAIIKAL